MQKRHYCACVTLVGAIACGPAVYADTSVRSASKTVVLSGHTSSISSAVFSPDAQRVLTRSRDGTARLWDAATGAQLAVLQGQSNDLRTAIFSKDGTKVITASADGARLWDA